MAAGPAMNYEQKSRWFQDLKFWIGIGIGVLGILATILVYHFQGIDQQKELADSKDTIHNLQSEIKDLKATILEPSLQPGGGFPNRIETATKRIIPIAQPHDKLLIFLDDFATESYSSPKQFADYFNALQEAKAKQVDVEVIASGVQDFHESFTSQFQTGHWKDGKYEDSKSSFKTYNDYLDFYTYKWRLISEHGEPRRCGQKPKTFREFEKTLQCTENEYCKAFKEHGFEPKRWPSEKLGKPPLYFWLVPGKKLLFTIPKFGQKGPIDAPSFITGQPDILNVFQQRFMYVDTVAIPDAVCAP